MGTRKDRTEGKIGERISFKWNGKGTPEAQLSIEIDQAVEGWKICLLGVWLVMWAALEAVVVYFWTQDPSQGNAWLGYAIYTAFWAFFAFRIGKVALWRWRGKEIILADRRGISIAMAFGRRGLPDFFAHGAHNGIRRVKDNPTQILRTFEKAFWSMGGETLQFQAGRRTMVFGKQLVDRDADGLMRLLNPALDKLSRKTASAD